MSKYIGGYKFWQSKIKLKKELILIEELAYSFHLGNDKNKTKKARQIARNSKTGTTSFNNNGIQTAKQLSKVFNHNYRIYENNQEDIYVLKGTTDLIKDVKGLYLDLFEEARIKYNEKQVRNDRKIDNYFNHISNNDKTDLACEIIIELGDMEFWENKMKPMKLRMNEVFKEQIDYLEKIVPNFKVASAVSHFDEHSPHLHIVGVPFKEGNKNGMEITVGKSAIFTKDSLKVIQDQMRLNCIMKFNEIYNIDLNLKEKRKGRNNDILTSEMDSYKQTEKTLKKEIKKLEEVKTSNTEIINEQEQEIAKKKKYNRKIVLRDKASLIKENEELKEELSRKEWDYKVLEEKYDTLQSKVDYVLKAIKKVITKIPSIIAEMIETLFDKNQSIWTHEHNQLVKEKQKEREEYRKNNPIYNIYDKKIDKPKEKDKDDFDLSM